MARLLVLLGALCGIAAGALPLFKLTGGSATLNISVLNLWQGPSAWREQVGEAATPASNADDEKVNDSLRNAKLLFTGITVGPAVLALLLALLASGGFGRGRGTLALVLGLLGLGAWALLSGGIDKAAEENKGYTMEKGIAPMLVLASACAVTLGGLAALVRPARKTTPS